MYIKSNKGCFFGQWKENKRNGIGIEFGELNNVIYEGQWVYDFKEGMGLENY